MKLALIGPAQPFRGGISQYNTQLFHRFGQRHQVLLINFRRQYPGLFFPGTSQYSEPRPPALGEPILDSINPLSWSRAGLRLFRFGPGIALFQWWHAFFGLAYLPILRRLGKLPPERRCRRLFLCHNVYPHERAPGSLGKSLESGFIRRVFSQVDGFITQSEGMREQIRELAPDRPVRKVLHPCYDHFGGPAGELQTGREGELKILFFGNIRSYKGLDVLLEALARLPPDLDWRLRVAGEFYHNGRELLAQARGLGIDSRVEWETRFVPDSEVSRHFRWAEVVAAPYRTASQSGVIPLAYHFGLPVITTQTGGLSEVVREGETGLMAPPGDPAGLAEAIRQFAALRTRVPWSKNVQQFRATLSWAQVEDAILSFAAES